MASKAFSQLSTTQLFEIVAGYVLDKWLSSESFIDDIDEPRCLIALQHIAKRLGIDFEHWLELTNRAKPKWFKESIKLEQILQDVNIDF